MVTRAQSLAGIDMSLTGISRLARTRRASQRRQQQSGVALDDTSIQALGVLHRLGPMRLGELAAAADVEVSHLSKRILGLASQGLVTHEIDPSERRARVLTVTPKGRRIVTRYHTAAKAIVAAAFGSWSDDELAQADITLRKISESFTTFDKASPLSRATVD